MYGLSIESPFIVTIDGKEFQCEALLRGYGAKNGMLISNNGDFFNKNSKVIMSQGYGYSCFNIHEQDVLEGFEEVLEDWGKV